MSDSGDAVVELIRAVVREELSALLAEFDSDPWPEWMSVETAARYLDVSPERLRKFKATGEIPYYQEAPGCRVMFSRRDLDEWMRTFRQGTAYAVRTALKSGGHRVNGPAPAQEA